MTNVFKKLQNVRHAFASANIKKSGKNKFAGYEYFELGDFIPVINKMFDEAGLIGVVRFTQEEGSLAIYNTEKPDEKIVFTSPMVFASNPKGQAIQDLGSTHTYMRRYLWLMAMEIVEHDAVDSAAPTGKPEQKPEPKAEKKAPEKTEKTTHFRGEDDRQLFLEKLIEHAVLLNTRSELADIWKSNQPQIDELKATDSGRFEELKTAFTEIKANLEE